MTTTSSETSYSEEPVDFICTVTFDTASGATTMVGGAVQVDARNITTGARVSGTASIASATTIRCTFAAGALAAGVWEILVLATPSGYSAQVVAAIKWTIKAGAAF